MNVKMSGFQEAPVVTGSEMSFIPGVVYVVNKVPERLTLNVIDTECVSLALVCPDSKKHRLKPGTSHRQDKLVGSNRRAIGEDERHVREGVSDGGRLPMKVGDEVRETRGVPSPVCAHYAQWIKCLVG